MCTLSKKEVVKQLKKIEEEYRGTIELKIRPLIIQLRMLKLSTSGCCEGHTESNCFPWVMFVTKRPKGKLNSDDLKKWGRRTLKEISSLRSLLEEFYSKREVLEDQRLDIEFKLNETPLAFFWLQPRGAKVLELFPKELLAPSKKNSILKRHQEEISAFTEFLQNKTPQ